MPVYPPLRLASASPRRVELLRTAGVVCEVEPAGVEEVPVPGETPEAYAVRLAAEKAAAVAARHPGSQEWVLGADTVVALDDQALEKPIDAEDAHRMLRSLSGRSHRVITGVALHPCGAGTPESWPVMTQVVFREISEAEIAAYVATGDPMDKAGAYAIQGGAAGWVRRIEGSYTNVVGLPVCEVLERLLAVTSEGGDSSPPEP